MGRIDPLGKTFPKQCEMARCCVVWVVDLMFSKEKFQKLDKMCEGG